MRSVDGLVPAALTVLVYGSIARVGFTVKLPLVGGLLALLMVSQLIYIQ